MAIPIAEIFAAIGFKIDDKSVKEFNKNVDTGVNAMKGFALKAVAVVTTLNLMTTSLLRNNQAFINFNRQTGLSIANMNKIAQAGMMVDFGLDPKQVMSSIQSLESNLASIRIGQGNISPFQILGVSPVGKDAYAVIDDLREAIKGVDDMTAVNLIQQMGLSPEFISILRMSKEEIESFNQGLMLSEAERKAMQQRQIEFRKIFLELGLVKDRGLIAILPVLTKIMQGFTKFMKGVAALLGLAGKVFKVIWKPFDLFIGLIKRGIDYLNQFKGLLMSIQLVLFGLVARFHPVIATLTALYLILEDLAVYAMGGKSLTGEALKGMQQFGNNLKDLFTAPADNLDKALKIMMDMGKIPVPPIISSLITMGVALSTGFGMMQNALKNNNNLSYAMPNMQLAYQGAGVPSNYSRQSSINQTNNFTVNGQTNGEELANLTAEYAFTAMQADRTV